MDGMWVLARTVPGPTDQQAIEASVFDSVILSAIFALQLLCTSATYEYAGK